mgnify:CR=1 FL=1
MKLSEHWLRQWVSPEIGTDALVAQLSMAGLEVDGVEEIAVVGYPDPRLMEVPVAYVVKRPGSDVSGEQLIERCRGRIASFKIPRHVQFIDAMPATASGKIRKVELRDDAAERFGS